MARPLRIEYEGAVHHILSRGNKAEFIFKEDADKEYFLHVLQRAVEKYALELYAYCIMGNHYHLLMEVPSGELSKAMHMIQSSYGSYQQRVRGWIGHVFAGRYKALCVEKETYLLELSRYLHLNPVRAGMVKKPHEYRWSSYRYYAGKEKEPEWLNVRWLLKEYGRTRTAAAENYREFVEAGINSPPAFPSGHIAGQAVLGSAAFTQKVMKGVERERVREHVASKRDYRNRIRLDDILQAVCRLYKVERIEKGRRGGQSRDMFIYLAKQETTALNSEIGLRAGGIGSSAVSHQHERKLKSLEQDKKAMRKWLKDARAVMSFVRG